MEFALWRRAAVGQLIEQEYGIKLRVRSLGRYLARWDFMPLMSSARRLSVNGWTDSSRLIAEKARAEGGEIHWGDETASVNTDARGRSYAPAGQTPVAYAAGGTRQKLSMFATVTNQGKARWMIIDEDFNSDRLIEFLEALVKDATKKVFLILGNLRVHHSKPVKAWVAERQDKIELFNLPSYSSELNPEERQNADLKHAISTKVPARTKARLKAVATQHMTEIEQSPERVKAFFPVTESTRCRVKTYSGWINHHYCSTKARSIT